MTSEQRGSEAAHTDGYSPRPGMPGYWEYRGRPVQAYIETHQFVVAYAVAHCAPGTPVLDVAAGQGALAAALADANLAVSGTSWDGQVNLPIPVYRLDLDRPFTPADVGGMRYPLVAAVEIIEHVENPSAFLRSCRDVLAPGGHLVITTPNVESAPARLQWLMRGEPLQFSRGEVRNNRHISMMWREGLEALFATAGLQVQEKHFVHEDPLTGLRGMAKRFLYRCMQRVLPGDLRGMTGIYVLQHAEKALDLGPGRVY